MKAYYQHAQHCDAASAMDDFIADRSRLADSTFTITSPQISQVVRSANDIQRDEFTGRLTYSNGEGGVTLITQEFTHRGFSRNLGEPEMEIRVRTVYVSDVCVAWGFNPLYAPLPQMGGGIGKG